MMRAVARAFGAGMERRMMSLADLDRVMDEMANGGADAWSGASVTASSVLKHDVAWACMVLRSTAVAQIPLVTFKTLPDGGGREQYPEHYLFDLLRLKVNSWTTAFTWKALMEMWICIYGNAYSWVEMNGRMQVVGLWAWHPSRVEVKWEDFEGLNIPFYYFRPDGRPKLRVPYWEILHFRGPSTDGFFGLSPIEYHRQTIGLGLALQEHGSRFFKNGATLGGILAPKAGAPDIGKDMLDRVKERWQEAYGGLANAYKTAFLPTGLEWQAVRQNMQESQYPEIAGMNVPQVCRVYGVPPHKVFELLRSTNNNIEHQDNEWRYDYLGPRLESWEQEINGTLLSDRERSSVQVEFVVNRMRMADASARAEYLNKGLAGAPWLTQDDARHEEGLNPKRTKASQDFPVTNNAPAPAAPAANRSMEVELL